MPRLNLPVWRQYLDFLSGLLCSNSVLIDTVFTRPGLGSLIIGSLDNRDHPTVQGLLEAYAATVIVVNIVADLPIVSLIRGSGSHERIWRATAGLVQAFNRNSDPGREWCCSRHFA